VSAEAFALATDDSCLQQEGGVNTEELKEINGCLKSGNLTFCRQLLYSAF